MKTALITGISGQDGSYLAEHLLGLGYRVVGMMRRSATPSTGRFAAIEDQIELVAGDLLDQSSLMRVIGDCQPDEVYNLAAQSFVHASFTEPIHTGEVTGLGVTRLLEAVRICAPEARFYQASSSEMFGDVFETPQTEATPFHPRSPYGVAKVYGHWATINYRESYDMYACSGILFNHESPRRGLEFVTRKITDHVAAIACGEKDGIALGNLDARRDWGFAGDYIKAMHLMLQQDTPDDYVISTNETHAVREFCEIAFGRVGLDYNDYVSIDPRFYRPAEVELLLGDYSKAKEKLGWEPEVSFTGLVEMMVDSDLKRRLDAGAEIKRGHLPDSFA